MARLNSVEPVRYAQSALSSRITGLLATKPDKGLDCTGMTSVDGFEITGIQPSGTERRFGVQIDGVWSRIESDGTLTELMEQSISADALLHEGNTAEELLALTSVPALVGKKVGLAVALSAPGEDAAMPTAGIGIKCKSPVPVTRKVEESPLFALADETLLISLSSLTEVDAGGTAVVEAQATKPDGTVSEWAPVSAFNGTKANAIRFRATLDAPQIGVSIAKAIHASLQYRSGDDIVSGVGVATLISITEDWYDSVGDCRLTAVHPPLADAKISARCALREKTSVAKGEHLGLGTGERKTYQLAHTDGISYDSLAVYYDGVRQGSGYELNTEVGRVTLTAPENAVVTADYVYGWTQEEWIEMPVSGFVRTPENDRTEYKVLLPGTAQKSICAVRIDLETTEGNAEKEPLGTGTGKDRVYPLAHIVKDGMISVFADDAALPQESWVLREDNRSVAVAAPAGQQITATYDWVSETPRVGKFIAVFG